MMIYEESTSFRAGDNGAASGQLDQCLDSKNIKYKSFYFQSHLDTNVITLSWPNHNCTNANSHYVNLKSYEGHCIPFTAHTVYTYDGMLVSRVPVQAASTPNKV